MSVVYVETNFVLELAFEQEQSESCSQLLQLASRGLISLVIPAFSLAEPHDVISRRASPRARLNDELRTQFRELGRSKSLRHIPEVFDALASVLIQSAKSERECVRRTVRDLLQFAEIIPLTAASLLSATSLEDRFAISGQDSIVLASVLLDLQNRRPVSCCFMNRNSRDFDDPNIREDLAAFSCKLFSNFDDGLRYVKHHLK